MKLKTHDSVFFKLVMHFLVDNISNRLIYGEGLKSVLVCIIPVCTSTVYLT